MGKAWGWQWRRMLAEEPAGARSWWPTVIEHEVTPGDRAFEFLLGDALVFHCAFKQIQYRHRVILANHYIDPNPVKVKSVALNIATRTWWQRLHTAHVRVSDLVDARESAQRAYAHRALSGA